MLGFWCLRNLKTSGLQRRPAFLMPETPLHGMSWRTRAAEVQTYETVWAEDGDGRTGGRSRRGTSRGRAGQQESRTDERGRR